MTPAVRELAGSVAVQLRSSLSAVVTSPVTSSISTGSGGASVAPGLVEVDRDLEEQDLERRLALRMPRRGTGELAMHRDAADDVAALAQREPAASRR